MYEELTVMPFVYGGYSKTFTGCVLAPVGAINEPKLGIALLFEKMFLLQSQGLIPHFGGVWTAYAADGTSFVEVVTKLAQVVLLDITEEIMEQAKAEIRDDFLQISEQPVRYMKFLYRQVAFDDKGVSLEEKLRIIDGYTLADVQKFAEDYYSPGNLALVYVGPQVSESNVAANVSKYFHAQAIDAPMPPRTSHKFYYGGFRVIKSPDQAKRLMLGFKATDLSKEEIFATQVLVAYINRQLRYVFNKKNMEVTFDFRVVNYYGERTLRTLLTSETADALGITAEVVSVINWACRRICPQDLFEKAQRYAPNSLDRYENLDNQALSTILDFMQQEKKYSNESEASALYDVTAEQMQQVAQKIFSQSRLTYIVMVPEGEKIYSYHALMSAIGAPGLTPDEEKQSLFL